ncbi:MAG: isoprenylcysteine carboxylmethyltransferase family protein [bacterium]
MFPYLILRSGIELFSGSPGFRVAGAAIIVPGVLIYLWCAWGFTFIGRGTPAPIDPPKELVAAGLYRYVRNPMYVGVLLVLLGEAVYFGSAALFLYSVIVFIMFNLFIVIYEEPTLKGKFGESYERYCRAVPRWIPKFKNKVT